MRKPNKRAPGFILGGRYAVNEVIGSGGSGCVYLCQDLRLPGKRWAVKESIVESDNGSVHGEAEMLIGLTHPRLPRVVDFFPPGEDGCSYLVMDYIEGVTLDRYLASRDCSIEAEALLLIAMQILEVLQYLHEHNPPIVYRDLKPSNLMLTPEKGLVLIDFGIARRQREGAGSDTVKLGTVGFAAPEQYGGGQSGPRSDLYGLGALLLYLATGGKFSEWAPGMERRLEDRVPGRMIPVLRKLLRSKPEDRYSSAAEVMDVLAAIHPDDSKGGAKGRIRVSKMIERPLLPSREAAGRSGLITIRGTCRGIGVTHTSLAAAQLLARQGQGPVAWVDWDPASPVRSRIGELAAASGQRNRMQTGGPVELNGIHFWKRPEGGLDELDSGYRYIVLDMGSRDYGQADADFWQGDFPLILASGADWRWQETLQQLRRMEWRPDSGGRILLPLAVRDSAEMLRGLVESREVYALPWQASPFDSGGPLTAELKRHLLPGSGSWGSTRKGGLFREKRTF